MQARLRHDYRSRYPDPIAFRAGERVQRGAADREWPEFVWATDERGRSGWVHRDRLDGDLAIRDYDGRELDAEAGDLVRLIELAGGWWWAENSIGEQGWLPERDLDIEPPVIE